MARGFSSTRGSGTSDIIKSPLTSWPTSQWSISCWVKRNGAGGNNFGRVVSKEPTTTSHQLNFGYDAGNTRWGIQFPFTTTTPQWTGAFGATATGTWFHFLITYDGSSTSNNPVVYRDGTSQTVTRTTAPVGSLDLTASSQYSIGNRVSDSLRVFDGDIGHVAIWHDVLLGQAEATQLANGGCPLQVANTKPVAYVELVNTFDVINGACTVTGTAAQTHYPKATRPRGRRLWFVTGPTTGVLAGEADAVAGTSATLKASGSLLGEADASASTSAAVVTSSSPGVADAVTTATGTLKGTGALAGRSDATATQTGDLRDDKNFADAVTTATGTLAGTGSLGGTDEIEDLPLVGAIASDATATGTLTGLGTLSGRSDVVSDARLEGTPITGRADAAAGTLGIIGGTGALAGTSSATGTFSEALTLPACPPLATRYAVDSIRGTVSAVDALAIPVGAVMAISGRRFAVDRIAVAVAA